MSSAEFPTNVERVMLKIRQRGAFKPYGSAVSAIEMALWDLAGKAAGLPVYKLLGGKVRDKVRIYNGAVRFPMTGYAPRDYAENMAKMKAAKEGFTIIKQGIAFHSPMVREVPDMFYGTPSPAHVHGAHERGLLTERGLKHIVACVEAMKLVLGDEVIIGQTVLEKIDMRVDCKLDDGTISTSVHIEAPTRDTLKASSVIARRNQPDITTTVEARWLGADCGNLQYRRRLICSRACEPPHPALSPDTGAREKSVYALQDFPSPTSGKGVVTPSV